MNIHRKHLNTDRPEECKLTMKHPQRVPNTEHIPEKRNPKHMPHWQVLTNLKMASALLKKTRRRRPIPRSTYKAGGPGSTTFDFALQDTGTVDLQEYEVEHHIDRKLKDFKCPSS